jgi:hypothetical protein
VAGQKPPTGQKPPRDKMKKVTIKALFFHGFCSDLHQKEL